MKKVIVRINDNYSLDQACAAILKLYGYLSFVEQFKSFQILTFDCPAAYQSNVLNQLTALNVVKRAVWDKEVYGTADYDEGETLAIETSGTPSVNTPASGQATSNTRTLTTTGSGTIYVKVANYSGNLRFQLSSTQGGVYSRIATYSGFVQGGTYTFDQSDSSNTGHRLAFSLTPDGTHNGGTQYTYNITTAGTPGSSGAYTRITVDSVTASVLYWYNVSNSNYGAYDDSPLRYGAICIHDFWHLDRISKTK